MVSHALVMDPVLHSPVGTMAVSGKRVGDCTAPAAK